MRPFLIAKMSLKMMLREPLVLIWNLGFPVLVFHVSKFMHGNSFERINLQFFNTMIAYTIVMNCIYGIGLCLVGWREDGLLRTFVHGIHAQFNLVLGLIIGISVLNSVFATLMFFSCNMFGEHFSSTIIIKNIPATLAVSFVFGSGTVLTNKVPLRWKTLSTIISIFGWLMMVESSFASSIQQVQAGHVLSVLSAINPIRFVRMFFEFDNLRASTGGMVLGASFVFLAAGWWATRRLSQHSCERR